MLLDCYPREVLHGTCFQMTTEAIPFLHMHLVPPWGRGLHLMLYGNLSLLTAIAQLFKAQYRVSFHLPIALMRLLLLKRRADLTSCLMRNESENLEVVFF
jgi:hypothetical protein